MVKLVTLFNLKDGIGVTEFERYYREVHVPLARALPGLRRYTRGLVRPSRHRPVPPFYRIAELYFDDIDTLKAALASPQGEAINRDTPFFSRVKDMVQLVCEEEEVPLG